VRQINALLSRARHYVDTAYAQLQNAEALAAHVETQLGLEQHWEIGCPEYMEFKEEATLGKYRTALNELERLVVMRLFELAKLSMSGTGKLPIYLVIQYLYLALGYKLRQQIGKALQRRSDAIRNAINRYNAQAASLNPPRPKISWKDIVEYSFLGEFDLLRDSWTPLNITLQASLTCYVIPAQTSGMRRGHDLRSVKRLSSISGCSVHVKK